jgi:hypothetical protein
MRIYAFDLDTAPESHGAEKTPPLVYPLCTRIPAQVEMGALTLRLRLTLRTGLTLRLVLTALSIIIISCFS